MPDHHEEQDWGRLFVTRRCCGAATCRNVAPELLGAVVPARELPGGAGQLRLTVLPDSFEEGAFTGVLRQPRSQADLVAARTAAAIGANPDWRTASCWSSIKACGAASRRRSTPH